MIGAQRDYRRITPIPNSSSSAFASLRSGVSKPSVNQPVDGARRSQAWVRLPRSRQSRAPKRPAIASLFLRLHAANGQTVTAPPNREVTDLVKWLFATLTGPSGPATIFHRSNRAPANSFSAAGTIRRSGVRPATSSRSFARIASLNFSRSLIGTTNEPGPPITQSS